MMIITRCYYNINLFSFIPYNRLFYHSEFTISLNFISFNDFTKHINVSNCSVITLFILEVLGAHYYNDIFELLHSFYKDLVSYGNIMNESINSWDYSYNYFTNVSVGMSSLDGNTSTFYIVNYKYYYCYSLNFNITTEMFDLRILPREHMPTYLMNVVYPNYFIHYTPDYYSHLAFNIGYNNGHILTEAYNYAMKSDFSNNFNSYIRYIIRNRMSMHFFFINDYYTNMLIFRRGCPFYSLGLAKTGLFGQYYNDIYTSIVQSYLYS